MRILVLAPLAVLAILAAPGLAAAPSETGSSLRIIGGTPVEPGAWPWQVALLTAGNADTPEAAFCGGALIAPQWILTAAHCVYDDGLTAADLEVLAGTSSLAAGGQRIPVQDVIVHPSYDGWTGADAALLHLEETVDLIPLAILVDPASPLLAAGAAGVATGWGGLVAYPPGDDPPQDYPGDLYQVTLGIIPDPLCRAAYGDAFEPALNFCAGDYDSGGVDTCQGDSGGPFVVRNEVSGRWYLAGITSFGDGCGAPGYPGVYTQVSAVLAFILDYVDLMPPGLSPRAIVPVLTHN